MLRLVVRIARTGLFVVGTIIVVCTPPSFFAGAHAQFPWPAEAGLVAVSSGVAQFSVMTYSHLEQDFEADMYRTGGDLDWSIVADAAFPRISRGDHDTFSYVSVSVPLWLLATICLAWPVTSLLVRRRRRGRGFEVEAKGGGAVSTANS
jgi:hypothetical protein